MISEGNPYGITGIFNDRKHGKTTFMVKDIVSKVHSGAYDQAFFNIHVGPKTRTEKGRLVHYGDPKIGFIDFAGLMKLHFPTVDGNPRVIVGIDQMPNYLDSRTPHAERNTEMSKWVRESRQHGCDLDYTSWARKETDKRLRPFTDLVVAAHRTSEGFFYRRTVRESGIELKPVRIPWAMAKETWKWFDSAELIDDSTIP